MGRHSREEWERRVTRAEVLLIEGPTSGVVVNALRVEFGGELRGVWLEGDEVPWRKDARAPATAQRPEDDIAAHEAR